MSEQEPFVFLEPGRLVDDDLELVLNNTKPGDASQQRVPVYIFAMRRTGRQENIGSISLRVGNIERIVRYAGHIGYGVEPQHRGHHYASRACRLLLPLAKQHGLNPLWI